MAWRKKNHSCPTCGATFRFASSILKYHSWCKGATEAYNTAVAVEEAEEGPDRSSEVMAILTGTLEDARLAASKVRTNNLGSNPVSLHVPDGRSVLARVLVSQGLAKPYEGKKGVYMTPMTGNVMKSLTFYNKYAAAFQSAGFACEVVIANFA